MTTLFTNQASPVRGRAAYGFRGKPNTAAYDSVIKGADRQKGDCGIVSLSVATGVDYEVAAEALRRVGKKDNQGTWAHESQAAAELLGFKLIKRDPNQVIKFFPGIHSTLQNLTAKHPIRFAKVFTAENLREIGWSENQIWETNGHFLAIKNGRVEDWSASTSKRVVRVWNVVKSGKMSAAMAKFQTANNKAKAAKANKA